MSFGSYELVGKLGAGGMGVVYRARDVRLNRMVALKTTLLGAAAAPTDTQRFLLEAEAVAGLDHPNIVPIFDIGEQDGQPYFSMKLIEGTDLGERKGGDGRHPRELAKVLSQVARAVHYAHQRGILHRDLKPGNILIDADGEPYVTDFGLAKRLEGEQDLTQTGYALGTPSYMAPEQALGEKHNLTTAVDVYSLGAVLYQQLTGVPPFAAESPIETALKVVNEEVKPPRERHPGVDRDLETICLKCLEKEPHRRYASAQALADDLDRFRAGEPLEARPLSTTGRLVKWARRRRLAAAVVGISAAALVALIAAGVLFNRRLDRELRVTQAARQDLLLALTRQVAERIDGDFRRLGAVPQSLAVQLGQRRDWDEEQLTAAMREMVQTDPRIFAMAAAFEPNAFAPGRQDFALYVHRAEGGSIAKSQLTPDVYQPHYREWPWYRDPHARRRALWSDPYFDAGGGQIWMTTHSVPFERGGVFTGVVTADVALEEYSKVLGGWIAELKLGEDAYGFVLDQTGAIAEHPNPGHFRKRIADLAQATGSATLAALDGTFRLRTEGLLEGLVDERTGRPSTVAYARVPSSGWTFVAVVPVPRR
jgi:hypothetical protein